MKRFIVLTIMLSVALFSQELRIKANSFSTDEKKGISTFEGAVSIIKVHDELNASKVVIYTDSEHKPTKFVANGGVSFKIRTKDGSKYGGNAEEVIYLPTAKEYHFYRNVHLSQLDEKKEIIGDEVVLKVVEGKAYAKGQKSEPVIMIFNIDEEKEE